MRSNWSIIIFNELDICGTFFEILESEHGFIEKKNLPINNEQIKRELLYRPWTLFNPTLCIRQSVFANYGLFDGRLEAGYDYDFLLRVADNGNCGNVPELLYQWTLHKESYGWQKKGKGNLHFQSISIKKINSEQTKLLTSEKMFCEGMVHYYANSFHKAGHFYLKALFSGYNFRKSLFYLILSTFLSPLIYFFRKNQLFSHPRVVKVKNYFNDFIY